MLRFDGQPIGDSNTIYQTFKGQFGVGADAKDVIIKVLRNGADRKAFDTRFASAYQSAEVNGQKVYYRNFIEGETLEAFLKKNSLTDGKTMELSNKLLSFLNFLHTEKQFHNRLSADHILLKNNQIYLVSEDNSLSNNPEKDISAFGNVLEAMLKKGKKNAFYRDIVKKCTGEGQYFRTISDVLYRFKNRVTKLSAVPESFDNFVLNELNEHDYPPDKATQERLDEEAYRMVIDNHLVDKVVERNKTKVVPKKKGIPRWAVLLAPLALLLVFGTRFMSCSNSGGTPRDIRFTAAHDSKQELGSAFSFMSNTEDGRSLQWTVHDYSGRKIIQEKNKRKFTFQPEKPGKYFVTLENTKNPERMFKDTIQVIFPGGKAQFKTSRPSPNTIVLYNDSPFADSVFYDFGDGLERMVDDSVVHVYEELSVPVEKDIQFAVYSNGQVDIQTRQITVRPDKRGAAKDNPIAENKPKPKKKPETTKEPKEKAKKKTSVKKTEKKYKRPIVRVEPNYEKGQVSFRPSTASYERGLKYNWYFQGSQKTGRRVIFNYENSGEYNLRVKVTDGDRVVHDNVQKITLTSSSSPIKDIKGTGLFKDNK